jgi:hypothetical protein
MDSIKSHDYKVSLESDYNSELKEIWNQNHESDIKQPENWLGSQIHNEGKN